MAWWRIGWLRPWDRNSLRFERSIVHLKSSWLQRQSPNLYISICLHDPLLNSWGRSPGACCDSLARWILRRGEDIGEIFFAGMNGFKWEVGLLQSDLFVCDSLACWTLWRGEEKFFTEDILGALECFLNMFAGPINRKLELLQSNDQFEADRACQAFHVSNIVPQLARGADLTIMVWDGVYFHLIMFNIHIFETNLPLWPPHPTIMITSAHFHFNTFLISKPTSTIRPETSTRYQAILPTGCLLALPPTVGRFRQNPCLHITPKFNVESGRAPANLWPPRQQLYCWGGGRDPWLCILQVSIVDEYFVGLQIVVEGICCLLPGQDVVQRSNRSVVNFRW